jgi:hypothetical protein
MHRPALRVPRLGFALIFLPVLLGSASSAPALGHATSSGQPASPPIAATPPRADHPEMVAATIPCISGSCQVLVYAPVRAAASRPLPRTTSKPQALAQR